MLVLEVEVGELDGKGNRKRRLSVGGLINRGHWGD